MQRQDIAAHIRNARPVRLRVVLNDETEKGVAMPRGRNRADKAAGVIDGMPWATVYMLDAKGDAIGLFHRDDSTAPQQLEEIPKNPTMAVVQAVMSCIAPVVQRIHQCATESASELVIKVRATHKDEMGVIFEALSKALTGATERAAGFEQRCNDMMAENDELREQVAELRNKQGPSPADAREAALIKSLTGIDVPVGNTNATPEGGAHAGSNGVSG